MSRNNSFEPDEFVPGLHQALRDNGVDLAHDFMVVLPRTLDTIRPRPPVKFDRHLITVSNGPQSAIWRAESIRELFRGNSQPPELGDEPEIYLECFELLDWHAVELSNGYGDRTDDEMREIYSNLRRRPDGKSPLFYQDYMWQVAALMLAMKPLSQAEYEAILGRLEKSCRTFRMGHASRNYIDVMRSLFGD